MTKIQSLLSQAAVIRDATSEGENTALRVGSMFVSLIQSIVATLPAELLDATGISYKSGESTFIITFNTLDDAGNKSSRQIIIPAASQGNAGLLTPAKLKEINQAISDISKAVTSALEARNLATETLENIKAVWFDGVVTLQADELLKQSLAIAPTKILWDFTNNCFVGERDGKYYANWVRREGSDFVSVVDNKRYIVINSRQEYIGFGGLLEMIGSSRVYLTQDEYDLMEADGMILPDVEYNILEG